MKIETEFPKSEKEQQQANKLAAKVYPNSVDIKKLKKDLAEDRKTWQRRKSAKRKSEWAMWASWLALALAYAKKPSAAAKFRAACKKAGISANANTSIEALIGKKHFSGSRALIHKHSLAVRGAIVLGITPDALRTGKHGVLPLTLRFLINGLKSTVQDAPSLKVNKPAITWNANVVERFDEVAVRGAMFVLLLKQSSSGAVAVG
ncbi:MAG: hypothetical protein VW395_09570, partial [Methylotenera sp.]